MNFIQHASNYTTCKIFGLIYGSIALYAVNSDLVESVSLPVIAMTGVILAAAVAYKDPIANAVISCLKSYEFITVQATWFPDAKKTPESQQDSVQSLGRKNTSKIFTFSQKHIDLSADRAQKSLSTNGFAKDESPLPGSGQSPGFKIEILE